MVKALILTGGKSNRMGWDKYLLNVHGQPQYAHLYEMLGSLGLPTFLSVNKAQASKIPDTYPCLPDVFDGIGPMGGLATAIREDDEASWLLVACDLINITPQVIQGLLDANDAPHDVITYAQPEAGFLETTITIYNPGSFGVVRQAVEQGAYSLQGILKKCTVKVLETADPSVLKNVNKPEDL